MRTIVRLVSRLVIVLAAAAASTAAHAQLNRTWVASDGGGTTCSRGAPCLNFFTAHAATQAGGEISCVDSGDFGAVTITKAISIDCTGVNATVTQNLCTLPDNTCNTVNIAAGANDVVRLRGLSFEPHTPAHSAIRFVSGAALHIHDVVIGSYAVGPPGTSGIGIFFTPADGMTAKLYVENTTIADTGLAGSGGAIIIQPAGSGSARVDLHRVVLENNTYGVFANGTGSTGVIAVQIRDSIVTGSTVNGISAFTSAGHSTTSITLDHSASTLNGSDGILAQGANAFVFLKGSTVMSNATGLSSVSGGNIFSYQDNALTGNVTDGAPTAVLTVK